MMTEKELGSAPKIIAEKGHLTTKGIMEIRKIKTGMNTGRSF